MNLTIKDFQNFQGSGAIVISREQGYRNPEIEEAGFLHKVKSFFGFSSAKAKNRETIDALRTEIRNDPSFYLASHDGLSPEALAEEFVALVRLAGEIERELGGADDAQGGGESAASAAAMEDVTRINFGLGGFIQV